MSLLNSRQIRIIGFIVEKEDYIPVKVISKSLNVSPKTIYRDLETIEQWLKEKQITIDKKSSKGVSIKLSEKQKNELLFEIDNKKINNFDDELSVEYRRKEILFYLLQNSPLVTSIQKLSDKYFVGRTSIVNDLKYIEEKISSSNLRMEKIQNGTSIVGNEYEIRNELNKVLTSLSFDNRSVDYNFPSRIENTTLQMLYSQFGDKMVKNVEMIVNETEHRLGYSIGDSYYINLITHIIIAIKRIKSGNYVEVSRKEISETNLHIYRIVVEAAYTLSCYLDVLLPDSEVYFIYLHFVSSGIGTIHNLENLNQYTNEINKKEKDFCCQLVENVSQMVDLDLTKDIKLRSWLIFHVISMINRMKYNIQISCPLLEQAKIEFPNVYKITKTELCSLLKTYYPELSITEDEVCYVALYFQASIEDNIKQKRVLVVCSTGVGTSQLLKRRISRIYPNWNIVDLISSSHLKSYDLDSIDLILSTIGIDTCDIKVPIAFVSALFNDKDIKMISELLVNEQIKTRGGIKNDR